MFGMKISGLPYYGSSTAHLENWDGASYVNRIDPKNLRGAVKAMSKPKLETWIGKHKAGPRSDVPGALEALWQKLHPYDNNELFGAF